MPKKREKVGYEAFAKWEIELAKGKARGLVGKHGFSQEDLGDLEQELLLQIHLKRNTRTSWKRIEATEKTVMSRILDNRIRNIIESSKTDKRRVYQYSESIDKKIEQGEEKEAFTYETLLTENQSLGRIGKRPLTEETEIQLALSSALENLSDTQRRVCDLIMQGVNITAVAKTLQIKRTTLNRELERMRRIFYRKGLDDYI